MITKGTENYKHAQEMANTLTNLADIRKSDKGPFRYESPYEEEVKSLNKALQQIISFGGFAANVAETVLKSVGKYAKVAYISDKQAWILACAIVENGITF